MLNELRIDQQLQLIQERPYHHAWGPVIKWKDDMWYHVYYYAQFWTFPDDPLCLGCYPPIPEPMESITHPLSPCTPRFIEYDPELMDLDDIFE